MRASRSSRSAPTAAVDDQSAAGIDGADGVDGAALQRPPGLTLQRLRLVQNFEGELCLIHGRKALRQQRPAGDEAFGTFRRQVAILAGADRMHVEHDRQLFAVNHGDRIEEAVYDIAVEMQRSVIGKDDLRLKAETHMTKAGSGDPFDVGGGDETIEMFRSIASKALREPMREVHTARQIEAGMILRGHRRTQAA